VTFRPPVFERNVSTLHEAFFPKTPTEGGKVRWVCSVIAANPIVAIAG
jgi:hypothetical protein